MEACKKCGANFDAMGYCEQCGNCGWTQMEDGLKYLRTECEKLKEAIEDDVPFLTEIVQKLDSDLLIDQQDARQMVKGLRDHMVKRLEENDG